MYLLSLVSFRITTLQSPLSSSAALILFRQPQLFPVFLDQLVAAVAGFSEDTVQSEVPEHDQITFQTLFVPSMDVVEESVKRLRTIEWAEKIMGETGGQRKVQHELNTKGAEAVDAAKKRDGLASNENDDQGHNVGEEIK